MNDFGGYQGYQVVNAGVGMGSVLAMILSFQLNRSIWWAILHGFFSWFYVIYRGMKQNY